MGGPRRRAPAARLNGALKSVLSSKEVRDKLQAQAFEASVTTPEEAGRFIAAEAQRFAKLIKTRGITAN